MPIFDTSKMSRDEFNFIRAYCAAVRRDFAALEIIFALQDPKELNVKCPFEATRVARGITALQKEYADAIADHGAKLLKKPKAQLAFYFVPSLDDIGYIFTISFFKIVDADTKQVIPTSFGGPRHDGWSSGRPEEWQQTLSALYDIQKQQYKNDFGAGITFSKLFKLFSSFQNKKKLYLESYDDYVEEEEDDEDYDEFF